VIRTAIEFQEVADLPGPMPQPAEGIGDCPIPLHEPAEDNLLGVISMDPDPFASGVQEIADLSRPMDGPFEVEGG
jgi:hypothetical protein